MVYLRAIKQILLKEFLKVQNRNLCAQPLSNIASSKPRKKEVRIPCPWGHISGVWWGRDDVQPILAVHGWLDNSGSWKRLAGCLVDDNTSLLALDLPGTGNSSHIPPFYNYHFSSSAAILRRVQLHFGFKDLVLFGHSGGSASVFLFSSIFPDLVKAYLAVDYLFYSYKRESARAEASGEVIDEFIELALKSSSPKSYSWEDAKQAWIHGSLLGATNPEIIEDLMESGMTKLGDGKYSFSRDIRLRHLKATCIDCFSVAQVENLAKSISCHMCVIKANNSPFLDMGIRNFPNIIDILKESTKSFQLHEIDGHHHVHMEHPEQVASIARSFLDSLT